MASLAKFDAPYYCLRCETRGVVVAGHWDDPEGRHRCCIKCGLCRECELETGERS